MDSGNSFGQFFACIKLMIPLYELLQIGVKTKWTQSVLVDVFYDM